MERLAFKMHLKPGQKEAYIKRHQEIWPELKSLLKDAGISEYSIFLDEDTSTLFAFQKNSGKGVSRDLGEADVMKRWWKYMADIMEVHLDNSPVSKDLEEVFYLK